MINWEIFIQSNAFNFSIMLLFFVALFFALKVPAKLQNAADKVKEEIEASDKSKEKSFIELEEADKLAQTVEADIKEINSNIEKNIAFIQEASNKEEDKLIETIKINSAKTIESTEKNIAQNLSKKTVLASFELAKNHIIQLLKDNPQYHQKFIEDSINELDGLKQ